VVWQDQLAEEELVVVATLDCNLGQQAEIAKVPKVADLGQRLPGQKSAGEQANCRRECSGQLSVA
jgi:hypothetical protein